MSVTERLMRPSTGSLNFTSDLPVRVSEQIRALIDERSGAVGAHVVITNARQDPNSLSDAGVLAAAKYTGRITKRPTRTSLEFDGLETWLDTYLEADTSRVAGTPSQWLSDLLANDLTAGTVTATGTTNVTRSFPAHITTRREALDVVAGLGGWEWKIKPDFTVDAAVKTTLFRSPPNVVVTRKSEGPDGLYRGVRGGMLDQSIDVSNLATKAVALAQGEGTAIAKGSATTSRSLRAPKGSAASFVTVFSAPSEESANANTAAQNFLNLQGARFDITVNSTTHDIPTFVRPGDEVYLYDIAAGIVDTSNQIQFRGETIFPAKVRCLELTWPIEEGCGVYIRSNAASPTWIDVTPWVEWESGDSWWKVGDWSPPSYGRANRSNPEVEDRIGSNSGNSAVGGDMAVTGDLTVGDDLTVTDAATIGGALGVTGAVTISGTTTIAASGLNIKDAVATTTDRNIQVLQSSETLGTNVTAATARHIKFFGAILTAFSVTTNGSFSGTGNLFTTSAFGTGNGAGMASADGGHNNLDISCVGGVVRLNTSVAGAHTFQGFVVRWT